MPQLGETVTEGTILKWAKQVGDTIAADEVLVEISTDKVDTEVPSPAAGTILEILVAAGESVAVGTPIAVIGETASADSPEPAPAPAAEPASDDVVPVPESLTVVDPAPAQSISMDLEPAGDVRLVSPVVRRLAREHNIDLAAIAGSGPG